MGGEKTQEPAVRDLVQEKLSLVVKSGKYDQAHGTVAYSFGHAGRAFPVCFGSAMCLALLFGWGQLSRSGVPFMLIAALTAFAISLILLGAYMRNQVVLNLKERIFTIKGLFGAQTGRIVSVGVNPCRTLTAHSRIIWMETHYYLFLFDGGRIHRISPLKDFKEHLVDLARDLSLRANVAYVAGPVRLSSGKQLNPASVEFIMNWWIAAAILAGAFAGIAPRILIELVSKYV